MFVNTAPKVNSVRGVPWSRVQRRIGRRHQWPGGDDHRAMKLPWAGRVTRLGGTKKWRTCYVADATGHAMPGRRRPGDAFDPVLERTEALALIHDGDAAMARLCVI
jgi:fumarate reductase flavoprotein subunit